MEWKLGANITADLLLTGYQRKWVTRDLVHTVDRINPDQTLVSEMDVGETNRLRHALANISLEHAFNDHRNESVLSAFR